MQGSLTRGGGAAAGRKIRLTVDSRNQSDDFTAATTSSTPPGFSPEHPSPAKPFLGSLADAAKSLYPRINERHTKSLAKTEKRANRLAV
jgi:hypothetical protein